MKDFLDRLPAAALAGRQALSVVTAGSSNQAEAADGYLRALLDELGAGTTGPGLTLTEERLVDVPLDSLDSLILEYLDRVRGALQVPSR
jgi:FMN reductase